MCDRIERKAPLVCVTVSIWNGGEELLNPNGRNGDSADVRVTPEKKRVGGDGVSV